VPEPSPLIQNVLALPHALAHLDDLRIRFAGKRPAVFLDFDGTLTPIVDKPDQVVLAPSVRGSLLSLAERYPLAVISGRDSADVRRYVGIDTIVYAGSHGYDIAWPQGRETVHETCRTAQPNLQRARVELERTLATVDGIFFEDKRCSFAVHFRQSARGAEDIVRGAVTETVRDDAALRVIPGKKVFEIMPAADWDKGKALLWLLKEMKLETVDTVPLFFGDDVTDEDAFNAIADFGIGILVCDEDHARAGRETAAAYTVSTPADVGIILDFLQAA
jgi:trehalose-phosphatase